MCLKIDIQTCFTLKLLGFYKYVSDCVAFFSLCRSVSMGDILNEDEMGHSPSLSQSQYERMHEQYNFVEEEEHWQDVRRLHDNCVSPLFKYAVLSSLW